MIKVVLTADASGAAMAGSSGMVVMVVDVIDFSTSMEASIDAGAAAVYGAAPDSARPPVKIDPHSMGRIAALEANRLGTGVILLAEPRVGEKKERAAGISKAIKGVLSTGARIVEILPNIGAETPRLADMNGMVVLGATGTGGVAFDAAVCAGAPSVLTGTVARTMKKSGFSCAGEAAVRAVSKARRLKRDIAVVAASGNSLEDLLAAEYIYKIILETVRHDKACK
ncbi:MAG: hypothetical protein ACOY30_09200 [Bacillota bacterium]